MYAMRQLWYERNNFLFFPKAKRFFGTARAIVAKIDFPLEVYNEITRSRIRSSIDRYRLVCGPAAEAEDDKRKKRK